MLRLFWIGWLFHLKSLMHSLFFVLISVLQPVIFASLAYFMFRAGAEPRDTAARLARRDRDGDLVGHDGRRGRLSIQRQRWLGVLELLVAAPTPFWAVLLPITIASSAIRMYSLVLDAALGQASSSGSRSTWSSRSSSRSRSRRRSPRSACSDS